MNLSRRTFATFAAVAPVASWSQSFPSKPVRLIVPYAPGGLPDTVARMVAQKIGEHTGRPIVVDNKPGGNGMVAYLSLMSGPVDDHNFIVSDGSMLSITPLINKAANYSIGKELTAASLIARSPLFLTAHPKTGIHSMQEFIDKVRANPGAFTYGSSGIGSSHHLSMEMLKSELKLDIRHVPFRGSSHSVQALLGGQIEFLFAALPSMSGFLKNQQVALIASNGSKRSTQLPNVPSIAEFVPGYDFSVTVGALARAGTSPAAIKYLADEIAWAVKQPDLISKLQDASIEPIGQGPLVYRKEIDRENQAMAKAGRVADLKAE